MLGVIKINKQKNGLYSKLILWLTRSSSHHIKKKIKKIKRISSIIAKTSLKNVLSQ